MQIFRNTFGLALARWGKYSLNNMPKPSRALKLSGVFKSLKVSNRIFLR